MIFLDMAITTKKNNTPRRGRKAHKGGQPYTYYTHPPPFPKTRPNGLFQPLSPPPHTPFPFFSPSSPVP